MNDEIRQSGLDMLTINQLAERFQIGYTKAWTLVARGVIPSVRIGRHVRIPTAALDSWIEEHTQGGTCYGPSSDPKLIAQKSDVRGQQRG